MENYIYKDAVIIGGGLTGLVTAFYLKKAGLSFHIIEKANRVGGVIQTAKKEGFVYEKGPNTGVLSNPETVELFEELKNDCKLEIAKPSAKRRLIWKSGQWHALPSGLISSVNTPLFSFKDKLRILAEPLRKKGTNPHEHLSELVKRRMGKSFLHYAVDPFILGIYAGDPDYLVPKYALPKLYNLEQNYGSFIKGAFKKKFEAKQPRDEKVTRDVFSVKNGLGELIHALEKRIGKRNIILDCKNTAVNFTNAKFHVNTQCQGKQMNFIAKKIINTAGAYELPDLYPFIDENQRAKIINLVYTKVAEIAIGFRNWQGISLNAFGGLVPFKEKRDILGVLFLSSFLENRAPENGALLSVFTGGFRRPELAGLPKADLEQLVKKEITKMMGLSTFQPDLFEIIYHHKAIPQYGETSGERFDTVEQIENQFPGLLLGGNLIGGIGMADRIKQGTEMAKKLIELLK